MASEDGGEGRFEDMARYRAEEKIDKVPQTPFMMVMRSARRKFLHRTASV